MAVAIVVALALGACSTNGPVPRDEPALRFSSPEGTGNEGRDTNEGSARVRRDAHGRPIYFREVPLDRHGKAWGVGVEQDSPCSDRRECDEDDGSASRSSGSGDR